ncbi:hypothetical protein BDV38DRAFT_187123 [Aspergillus pseudotamarii]|uniref:Uncharacterized protein n=1 Tax=Aspergillus pseudotamarii TaxID=132259 RepID=A0A5N6SIY0_ASPPS|nr:uncharacterized protein BDV38DRAFT_187123 [Aspergillus pseudotamarii]KAE8133333.1 hypothetical protein BDV38DRAFT_187123 [Aspergillus pseudotamarii]
MTSRFLAFLTIRRSDVHVLLLLPFITHNCKGRRLRFRLYGRADLFLRIIRCDCSPVNRRIKKDTKTLHLVFVFACIGFSCFYEDNIWMSWYPYVNRPGARTYVRATTIMRSHFIAFIWMKSCFNTGDPQCDFHCCWE